MGDVDIGVLNDVFYEVGTMSGPDWVFANGPKELKFDYKPSHWEIVMPGSSSDDKPGTFGHGDSNYMVLF